MGSQIEGALNISKNIFLAMAGTLVFAVPALLGAPGAQVKAASPTLDWTAARSQGSRQAPITIEIFSDYQCPMCKQLYEETTRQLIDNYVTTGKVYLIHHDFPIHNYSHEAARWMNAVAEVGNAQFCTAEAAMYAQQDTWAASGMIEPVLAATLSPTDMKKIHQIEVTQGAQLDAIVDSDIALGRSRHIDATPTICVTRQGSKMTQLPSGAISYTLLKKYLDYLLQH